MTRPVLLFVHGTGVRDASYVKTLTTIEAQVAEHDLAVDVEGCYWGGTPGATLEIEGKSVPGYATSGGGGDPSPADQETARWALLYTDPWYELRLLAGYEDEQRSFGGVPASEVLRSRVSALPGDGELAERLAVEDLTEQFVATRTALLNSTEFGAAVATAEGQAPLHGQAIARALVAGTLVRARATGQPAVTGATRDILVLAVGDALGAQVKGVFDFLTRPIKGIATWYGTRRRGSLTDDIANPGGDIMRYLARGEQARAFIGSAITALEPRPVVILAHSLGGIMSADILARQPFAHVVQLVTVGSQTPFLYEIGAFPSLEPPGELPTHFPRWLNVYDRRDLLSYVGAGVFPGRVEDVDVDNGQPFPESHSAYWTNPAVWSAVKRVLP